MPHCAFGMIWYCCYGSTRQAYQYDICKNEQKTVVGAKKSCLTFIHNLMPSTLEVVFQSFQISNFSGGGGGGMPLDPPSKRGLAIPCQYRRLLFSNWLPTSNFTETPVSAESNKANKIIQSQLVI